jgi:hypothetical protein
MPEKIICKIFCHFCSSLGCKEVFERINNAKQFDFYGKDKKIYITENDDYTHAVIMNTAMPSLRIPKKNVIGLAFEPIAFLGVTPAFVAYAQKHIGKYFIGDKTDLPEPFVEHFGYMWHSSPHKELTYKPNKISIVVSSKKSAPGHKYRHEIICKIIDKKLPIDIYGHGSNEYKHGEHIKGKFDDAEPYEKYLFTVCIENYQSNHYFSEKIVTPLLFNCHPIYYGCKNIDQYFDDIIHLSGRVDEDIALLEKIVEDPMSYYKKMYNPKNAKTVNFIENMERLFQEI